MLETKVSDEGTPSQIEAGECQHGGDITNTNVTDVDTSENIISDGSFLSFKLLVFSS